MDPATLIAKGPSTDTGPSAATKEAITPAADSLVSADMFQQAKAGEPIKIPDELKKEEQQAVERETKEEGKAADTTVKETEEKAKTTDSTATKPTPPTARTTQQQQTDETYGGLIDASAAPLLKKMSNDARDYVLAELRRRDKAIEEAKKSPQRKEGELPDNWYEQPQAFILSPEFQKKSVVLDNMRALADHYERQLINIREGQDWEVLIDNGKGGITKEKRKADSSADVTVEKTLRDLSLKIAAAEQDQTAFINQFNTKHNLNKSKMVELEHEYFPQYKDPKVLEADDNYKSIRAILQEHGLQNDRLAGMLSKLYVFALETVNENERLKANGGKEQKIAELQQQAGPTGDEVNKGETSKSRVSNPNEVAFDINAFRRAKGEL